MGPLEEGPQRYIKTALEKLPEQHISAVLWRSFRKTRMPSTKVYCRSLSKSLAQGLTTGTTMWTFEEAPTTPHKTQFGKSFRSTHI
jgi:hypothetical protein